jgi:hypothetical protein
MAVGDTCDCGDLFSSVTGDEHVNQGLISFKGTLLKRLTGVLILIFLTNV